MDVMAAADDAVQADGEQPGADQPGKEDVQSRPASFARRARLLEELQEQDAEAAGDGDGHSAFRIRIRPPESSDFIAPGGSMLCKILRADQLGRARPGHTPRRRRPRSHRARRADESPPADIALAEIQQQQSRGDDDAALESATGRHRRVQQDIQAEQDDEGGNSRAVSISASLRAGMRRRYRGRLIGHELPRGPRSSTAVPVTATISMNSSPSVSNPR